MNPIVTICSWLDRVEFLACRLWEFTLRNSRRLFPWYFFYRILLPHPIRALHGFLMYRRMVRASEGIPLRGNIDLEEMVRLLSQGQRSSWRYVIAPGFCMKPYDRRQGRSLCPAGHFTHDCLILDQSELLLRKGSAPPEPCRHCGIYRTLQSGCRLRAEYYIMTSAQDIARDLFLPAMRGDGARLGIFFLCPYSAEAFTFSMYLCGIRGNLITFCDGACADHEDFTRADRGIKGAQTVVEERIFDEFEKRLVALNVKKDGQDKELPTYARVGNIYRAKDASAVAPDRTRRYGQTHTAPRTPR